MVLVVLIDCLEDSEITGLPRELDRPNVQPARALRWYTSHKSFDATVSSDCSGSMMPTRLGKVRARRGDKCAIREGGPILPDYKPPVNTHRESIPWEIPAPFRIPVYDPIFNGRNPLCVIHTHGRLPLAVCDSGDINQRYDSDQDMFTYFLESSYQAPTYRLEYCTLGMCHLVQQKSRATNSPTCSTTTVE